MDAAVKSRFSWISVWMFFACVAISVTTIAVVLLFVPKVSNYLAAASSRDSDAVAALFDRGRSLRGPVCLSIKGSDPALELLAAIRNKDPKVIPASSCRSAGPEGGIVTAEGKQASYIDISDMKRVAHDRVTLSVATGLGFMFGDSSWDITIEFLDGEWVVTKEHMASIS